MLLNGADLPHRATVTELVESATVRDTHGNPTVTSTTTATNAAVFLQQQSSTELLQQRDTTTSRGVMFALPTLALTALSRVTFGHVPGTWRVIGDPNLLTDPNGSSDHLEAVVERVTG